MKNDRGQTSTEFVLVLPWLCGALLGFILLVLFCARAQLAAYAGFMGSRVYGVWPDGSAREGAMNGLLTGVLQRPDELNYVGEEGMLKVHSAKLAPYVMNNLSIWEFETKTPIVIEPMTSCEDEDNKILAAEDRPCS